MYYLCSEIDYALALVRNIEPEVLDTYSLTDRHPTEDELLKFLEKYDALSWATFEVKGNVVICKPNTGVVSTVEPLPPLVEHQVIRVVRWSVDERRGLNEAINWTTVFDKSSALIDTSTYEVIRAIHETENSLWDELDRDNAEKYDLVRNRQHALSWLSAECDRAFSEGSAYLLVKG